MEEIKNGKKIVGLYEEVLIAGPDGAVKAAAKADTASTSSNIERDILDEIGSLEHEGGQTVNVGETQQDRDAEIVSVELLRSENNQRVVEANIKDRDNLTGDFLIGQELLSEWGLVVDVDVKECNKKLITKEDQGYEVIE